MTIRKTKMLDDMSLRAGVAKAIKAGTEARFLDGGGLVCVVTKAGKARFIHRFEFRGRWPQRWYEGDYPRTISLAEARKLHAADCDLLDRQINPVEALKSGALVSLTFGEYARKHQARLAPPKDRNVAPEKNRWLKDVCQPVIRDIKIDDLRASDVEAAVKRYWIDFRPTPSARRVVQRIAAVIEHWHANTHLDDDHWNNPVSFKRLKQRLGNRPHHTRSHPSLSFRDAPAFLERVRAEDAMTYRALEFVILSGCRLAEATGARWSEIDWKARTWTIPASRLKTQQNKGEDGNPFAVPLSLAMVRLLRRAAANRDGCDLGPNDLIFPGRPFSRNMRNALPLTNCGVLAALKRLDPEITVHGFRATLVAWGVAVPHRRRDPFPLELMDQMLGHKIGGRRDEVVGLSQALATYANDAGADPFTLRRKIVVREWSAYLSGRPWTPVARDNVYPLRLAA